MQALFLIDHANVPYDNVSVSDIVRSWIDTWNDSLAGTIYVRLRAYGGWFEGSAASAGRFRAAEFYQQAAPMLLSHSTRLIRLSFEFADKLLVNNAADYDTSAPFITHTVAFRNSPMYIQRHASAPPCTASNCQLAGVKKWIKKQRACAAPGCPHAFQRYFGRTEQKQVDVHLAVDAVQLANDETYDHVVIVSEDWDLLPAVLAATRVSRRGGWSLVRFRESRTYLDSILSDAGLRFVNCVRSEDV